jgi:hypothetical protein
MQYRTVYEISTSTFWTNHLGAIIAIIVCAAIVGYATIFLRAQRKKNLPNSPFSKVMSVEEVLKEISSNGFMACVKEDLFVYIAGITALIMLVLTFFVVSSYLNHEKLLNAYKRGACKEIEGAVDGLNTTQLKNGWMESFLVDGHRFAYYDNELMIPGVQVLRMHGGPIKEGLNVRIWYQAENSYISHSDSIARLDIAESNTK